MKNKHRFVNVCRYFLSVQSKNYLFYAPSYTGSWFNIVVNFIGTGEDQGVRIYYNGVLVTTNIGTTSLYTPLSSAQIAIGRLFTDLDAEYGTFDIDELIFFNEALNASEIAVLSESAT